MLQTAVQLLEYQSGVPITTQLSDGHHKRSKLQYTPTTAANRHRKVFTQAKSLSRPSHSTERHNHGNMSTTPRDKGESEIKGTKVFARRQLDALDKDV
jgi:hypothetical protein